MEFFSDASCPTVDPEGCAEGSLPEHTQEGRYTWIRSHLRVKTGFGEGTFLSLQVPVDHRSLDLDFRLSDGTPYAPPYMEEYGDSVQNFGVGDTDLVGGHVWIWPVDWSVALSVGLRLPTGEVATERFQLGRVGRFQRQMQLGSGQVQPLVSAVVVKGLLPWRVYGAARASFSLGANEHGYQSGSFLGLEGGVSRALGAKWDLLAGLVLAHSEPDRWDDWVYPGNESLDFTLSATHHLGLNWMVELQLYSQIWDTLIGVVDEENNAASKTQAILNVSWRN